MGGREGHGAFVFGSWYFPSVYMVGYGRVCIWFVQKVDGGQKSLEVCVHITCYMEVHDAQICHFCLLWFHRKPAVATLWKFPSHSSKMTFTAPTSHTTYTDWQP